MNSALQSNPTRQRKTHYKKGGTAGIEGGLYQIQLLTLFLLNGLKIPDEWYLSTENDDSGKFDDLVFESPTGDIFLQAKHKKSKKKKIAYEDLLSTNSKNDDFSLPKYFFSHVEIKQNFNLQNVIICTNTDLKLDVELKKHIKRQNVTAQNMLYYDGVDGIIYTFSESILANLREPIQKYYDENLQKKNIAKEVMSDENIIDFLNQLQFLANYPNKTTLDAAIEKIISRLELHEELDSKVSSNYIHKKMQDWFKQERGMYLTKEHAKAFLCEIWSHEYCKSLEKLNLHFKNNEPPCKDRSKKFWHIIARQDYVVNVMKIYRTLQKINEKEILLVSPDYNNDIKKEIIEAFEIPSYTFLIIVCPKAKDKFITQEICNRIIAILNNYSYKKVILITEKDNKFIKCIKETNFYVAVKESVVFSDLDKDTQDIFMRQKDVVFQGINMNLKELLTPLVDEDLNDVISAEVLIKLAAKEKIEVGLEVTPLNEDVESYYISRRFKASTGYTAEEQLCHLDERQEEKIILISDSAGMGKSTVLTNLANLIKQNNSNLWVLKVDINNYTQILWEFRENNRKSIPLIELLNSQEETKLASDLEKKLFLMPGRVVLMIDGVDEISPDYKEIVLNLIVDCKEKHNFVKIFVTTRPHLREDLEKQLGVTSLTLNPFSKQNEVDFLTTYWIKELDLDEDTEIEKCKLYAETLAKEIPRWINDKDKNSFAGIPLQIRMLAEVFQEQKELDDEELEDWEGCSEFISSDHDKPKLPKKINLVKLYQLFMNKKRYIFLHDKSKLSGNVIMSDGVTKIYNECQLYHHALALEIILNKSNCDLLGYYKKLRAQNLEEKNVVRLGIVQRICGHFQFTHRTFAEFFVAECLLFELKCEVQSKEFQEFFISDILLRVEFNVIRAFLDSFLQKEITSLPTRIFQLYGAVEYESKLYGMGNTFLHILTQEDCIYVIRFFFSCLQFVKQRVKIDNIKDAFGKTLLHYACEKGFLDLVVFLIEAGAGVNVEDFDGCTPLHETIYPRHFDVLKYLLRQGADINAKDKKDGTALHEATDMADLEMVAFLVKNGADVLISDEDGCTALHLASEFVFVDVVQFLLENGADIHSKNEEGCSALHVGSQWGTLELVQLLLENGADVNAQDDKQYTALHKAAEQNSSDVFKYMVDRGGDISVRDKDGCTVLHRAARPNGLDIIDFLLNQGEDIDIKNAEGQTALHLAVKENYLDVIEFLVRKGANVNIKDNYGRAPLHVAVLGNFLDAVKFLAESDADVNIQDMHGRTVFHGYYCRSNFDMFTFLAEVGAGINIKDMSGKTALHYAVQREWLDHVKYLVEKGANVNFRDKSGCTPLHYAIEKDNVDIAKFLVENGAFIQILDENGRMEIHKAAKRGNLIMTKFLIKTGSEVNVKDKNGRTALHEASQKGYLDVVKHLVEKGADVNIRDVRGYTALCESVSESLDMIKFLVENGADVNIGDTNHYTALLLAALKGDFDKVKFLVENGANVNAKNKDETTALHLATRWGKLDMVRLLVENDADVNISTEDGTALHIAARWNYLDKVHYLADKGADANVKDKDGNTALHVAVRPRCLGVVKFLTERCVDVNAVNNKGRTALHEAIARGCLREKDYVDLLDVIKFLVGKGALVNVEDMEGRTTLHAAAIEGCLDVVKFVVQSDVDVNEKDVYNQTALDYAVQKRNLKIVEFLQK